MANTYTQIHIQFVFAVKHRGCVIAPSWETNLYKYITGIIQNHNHKLLAINGMSDHIHILVGMRPTQSIADFMRDVKGDSSKWINENQFTQSRFEWQEGYGAFSYSISQIPSVIEYIQRQKEHHSRKTFLEEYKQFLALFNVDFDEQYIFKELL